MSQTTTTFVVYDEDAHVNTTQKTGGGFLFDINGGYKVWSNLVVAVGYTFMSDSTDGAVTATIPDPRVFDSPRTVTTTADDLKHSEHAINFMGVWMVPVTDKIDVGISFGPTIFFVKQELPDTIHVYRARPYRHRTDDERHQQDSRWRQLRCRRDLPADQEDGRRRHSPLHVGFGRSRGRHRFADGRWISDRRRRALPVLALSHHKDRIHPDHRT